MGKMIVLIGYSGHGRVARDIFSSRNMSVAGYLDKESKNSDLSDLTYFGCEEDINLKQFFQDKDFFVSIGDNTIRERISRFIFEKCGLYPVSAIHNKSVISMSASVDHGVMIGPGCIINSNAHIHEGAICNSNSTVEHDCRVMPFSHVGPGAVLCGNVVIGHGSFVGANSVVKEGITIGQNVIIGAGSVIIRDVEDNAVVVGNPQRSL